MKGFCPLASGSKGNCLYLGSENTKVLIDAGLSGKATLSKLAEIGVSIEEIDAILVTHEHGDHIRGLNILAKRYNIPILANYETARGIIEETKETPRFKIFTTGEVFSFGDLEIHPFSIQHDTPDPVAFTIHTGEAKFGICADLGFVTTLVRTTLQDCNILYIEANHEPSLVHASARPQVYKQRVLGRSGHLSNTACGELIRDVLHTGLKQIYLAHLSEECNRPELALSIVHETLVEEGPLPPIHIAAQHQVSHAFHLP